MTWSAPTSTSGGPALGYEYKQGKAGWVMTTRTSVTIPKLPSGKVAAVSIRAYNSVGAGRAVTVRGVPQ